MIEFEGPVIECPDGKYVPLTIDWQDIDLSDHLVCEQKHPMAFVAGSPKDGFFGKKKENTITCSECLTTIEGKYMSCKKCSYNVCHTCAGQIANLKQFQINVVAVNQNISRYSFCFETQGVYFFVIKTIGSIKKCQDNSGEAFLNKDTQILVLDKLKLRDGAKELKVSKVKFSELLSDIKRYQKLNIKLAF